jgi:1,4-dihydroxy-2-naphthoate polyprenyltransferase
MPNFRTFIKLARPLQLLLAALTYSLGAGIAHYLGHPVQMAAISLGLLAVLAIQAASSSLVEYFRLPLTPLAKNESIRNREALQAGLFQTAMALLTGSGAIIVTLVIAKLLLVPAGIIIALIIFFSFAYAVPPMRLSETGYGELVQAVLLGILIPALAFFIQSGEFHRLLPFATFPITLLSLAYLLVNDFPTFVNDQKSGRSSMLIRLTWQRAIPIHHLLVLLSFLFFACTPLLGFPWGLVWPIFMALPFAVIEVIWLHRIARGGRSFWKYLIPFSAGVFGLTVYMLTLSFWIR